MDKVNSAPLPRTDNIGILAHQLIGGINREPPPDLTAAIPLRDALLGSEDPADRQTALELQRTVCNLIPILDTPYQINATDQIVGSFYGVVTHLLWDYNSVCQALAARIEAEQSPEELQKGSVSLETVKVRDPGARRGFQYMLPDGRQGVVVSDPNDKGEVDVLPTSGPGELSGQEASSPMGYGGPPPMPNRPRRFRRVF